MPHVGRRIPTAALEDRRWSLIDGEPRCMAPPSLTHGLLQAELAFLLLQHLRATRSDCRVVVAPGVVPHVQSQHNERVPDLAVTCSEQPDGRTITDPVLLVEILSPSNEADARRNVWAYTTIPSVVEILLLSSTSVAGGVAASQSRRGLADRARAAGREQFVASRQRRVRGGGAGLLRGDALGWLTSGARSAGGLLGPIPKIRLDVPMTLQAVDDLEAASAIAKDSGIVSEREFLSSEPSSGRACSRIPGKEARC